MSDSNKLSATQETILKSAAARSDGNIEPLPAMLRGRARTVVIEALLARGLIECEGDGYRATAAGYAAVGLAPTQSAPATAPESPTAPEPEAPTNSTNAPPESDETAKPRRTRDNTKQATVIGMLKRPEGATIAQIVEATGWQAHTVRGTFAGAFKKKLGLEITSTKEEGAERVYRVA